MNPRTMMRGSLSGAVAFLAVAVSWLMVQTPQLRDEAQAARSEVDTLKPQIADLRNGVNANAQALETANAKLIALGKAPVPVPSPLPSLAPTPALTAAELQTVREVVVEELDSHEAKVSQATINQITQAAGTLAAQNVNAGLKAVVQSTIAAYCVDDKCRGPVGPTGPAGRAGDNGKDAPAVTDEQLLQAATKALTAYCGQESKPCQGPAGKDAPPPYSVVDQDCVGDGDDSVWRIYLSNGTDQNVIEAAGPCRIGPDPN